MYGDASITGRSRLLERSGKEYKMVKTEKKDKGILEKGIRKGEERKGKGQHEGGHIMGR